MIIDKILTRMYILFTGKGYLSTDRAIKYMVKHDTKVKSIYSRYGISFYDMAEKAMCYESEYINQLKGITYETKYAAEYVLSMKGCTFNKQDLMDLFDAEYEYQKVIGIVEE